MTATLSGILDCATPESAGVNFRLTNSRAILHYAYVSPCPSIRLFRSSIASITKGPLEEAFGSRGAAKSVSKPAKSGKKPANVENTWQSMEKPGCGTSFFRAKDRAFDRSKIFFRINSKE